VTLSNVLCTVLLPALLAAWPLGSPAQSSFSGSYPLLDGDVIRYQSTPPNDLVARLQRHLDQGEAKLSFQEPHGYLLSVLQQLHVPLSSQTLVFSKTSSQQHLIKVTIRNNASALEKRIYLRAEQPAIENGRRVNDIERRARGGRK
jgi:hypothetical protein